jgi:hypothetical protein
MPRYKRKSSVLHKCKGQQKKRKGDVKILQNVDFSDDPLTEERAVEDDDPESVPVVPVIDADDSTTADNDEQQRLDDAATHCLRQTTTAETSTPRQSSAKKTTTGKTANTKTEKEALVQAWVVKYSSTF